MGVVCFFGVCVTDCYLVGDGCTFMYVCVLFCFIVYHFQGTMASMSRVVAVAVHCVWWLLSQCMCLIHVLLFQLQLCCSCVLVHVQGTCSTCT
jgi:hypothetical protein